MTVDRDQLVELITRKVMETLRGDGAPPAPPAPPASHDGGGSHGASSATMDPHDPETCERCRNFGVSAVRNPDETRRLAAAGASRIVATVGYCPASDGLASHIDHTLLKPDADRAQIEQLCREAAQFCFASVCVNPNCVPLCRELLRGSGGKVCAVIVVPSGAHAADVQASG